MCIIVIKPKNKKINDKKILETCYTANRDGAGYMFVSPSKEVIIRKGFMKFNDFYEAIMKDYKEYDLEKQSLVMHFRIGTSGKSKTGCTHPFAITDNFEQLELLRVKTNIGICHNGIIPNFNDYSAKHSDTQLYIASVLTPIIRLNINSYKFEDVQSLILRTTNSKWAILDRNDDVYTIGTFVEDDGYLYSNETFKKYEYKCLPTYNYTPKTATYDDDDEDDLDAQNQWWNRKYSKPIVPTKKHDVKYVMLNKGNIVVSAGLEYLEVEKDNEFYFDKDYSIYEKTTHGTYSLIGTNARIYIDDTLHGKREFAYE